MSNRPSLPSSSFEVLLDEDLTNGIGLPAAFRAVYGGDWRIPVDLPYVYVNFCESRDGRVSFSEPGHIGGADVAGFDIRDRWLMGLLRARADAVLVGDGTVRAEPEHCWTAEFVCPDDAGAFADLRKAEGRSPRPLQVVLSADGAVPLEAAVIRAPELDTIVVTTTAGARTLGRLAVAEVLDLGAKLVEPDALIETLAERYGVRTLLCEGGPRVYGSLLASGIGLDEFLTLAPLVLGEEPDGPARPSLIEGTGFAPGHAPVSHLLSVRRAGSYLYLRSRYGARSRSGRVTHRP